MEESENGLIFVDMYIPSELLTQIFTYVDHKSLLNCQLVCKQWEMLIKSYVWRKVAELTSGGQSLSLWKKVPWRVYYFICKNFGKNLIRNHSGDELYKHWEIEKGDGHRWVVENPPKGVPLLPSDDPILEGKQYCFVTSGNLNIKKQTIDLEKEGLTPYVLDNLRPPIEISEYCSCISYSPASSVLAVRLVTKNGKILYTFNFTNTLIGKAKIKWDSVRRQ
ncbi:F-box only protein 6-like [Lasioglossum baleicum]|uniref:F-box only protein 6-like n=1 Tax=Lasioglossum baleicum TaxID=434251 RepID=UPI003FCC8405